METQSTTGEKMGFLQNDRMLVCSMLVIYGICILGAIGATFLGLNRRSQRISANATETAIVNATQTAIAIPTQQVYATETALAHNSELGGYSNLEKFDSNASKWKTGHHNDENWIGDISIENSMYLWDIREVRQPFMESADCPWGKAVSDFDVYARSKIIKDDNGTACSGLIFRKAAKGWEYGGYTFEVCNNSYFQVSYYGKNGWEKISGHQYSSAIQPTGWNLIEVSARQNQYVFTINNVVVYEMVDSRRSMGEISLLIAIQDKEPAQIIFDSFGFERR